MQRRDFLKITAAGGAAAALEGCGNPDHPLIRFIPEQDLLPGIAAWKPSICTMCPAGCGTLVRVMEGEAEVVRNGQLGLLNMGLAKKIEGNPAHPINQGKLCPRGQASLQLTYHPDRIRTPVERSGQRGSGQFKEITWDDAFGKLAAQLKPLLASEQGSDFAFLTAPLRGQRATIVSNFVAGFHNARWVEFSLFDDAVARRANLASFGHSSPVTADLGRSNYVLSFGADFLGTWDSPVAQSIGYGQMRGGRPGRRGKFVHFESRISQTAASADEWVASPPGMDGSVALSLAHVILRDKLRPPSPAGPSIAGWSEGLAEFAPETVEKQTGIAASTIVRIAHEAAASSPAVALVGGAALAHTNGLFTATAVNALNALLGSVGRPGGLFIASSMKEAKGAAALSLGGVAATPLDAMARQIQSMPEAVKVLFLYNANPVFATPESAGVREALEKVPFIASFGSFIDETSVLSDLILPDHSPLESWLDDSPPSGSLHTVVSVASPVMAPLHNTRSMPDVLLTLAHQLGGSLAEKLPWKTYDEAVKAAFADLYKQKASHEAKDADEFWSSAQARGGWWSAEENPAPIISVKAEAPAKFAAAQFDGEAGEFPLHFLPFASQMFYDGSLAHLPWMQEAPDPLSSVMWGTWVEIHPRTAKGLGVKMGDTLEVASAHGKLTAPALVTPAIAPDVVAMPVGQGHSQFTRYSTGRGANPISILAPMAVEGIGSLAWAATRVKVTRLGEGRMVMFGGSMEEIPPSTQHR